MSIINDVFQAVKFVDRIAISKKEYRKNDKKNYIHSKSQKNKVLKIGKEFAGFCRENFGTKKLHEVTEEHYKKFLETKNKTSLGHQRNIETALQQVQKGMEERAMKYDKEFKPFMTERLTPAPIRTENVADRSYTMQEIQAIEENVTGNSRVAVSLMSNLGLRLSEACFVRPSSINFDDATVHVIGKGGKPRLVPIKNDFKHVLERLTENVEENERLVKTTPKTISKDCKKVADRLGIKNWTGTHGFRHSYARNEINRSMTEQEKTIFKRCLGRYAEGKKFDYGIKNSERELYNSMKNKMDLVHINLGHGKNRFDLALRYMA